MNSVVKKAQHNWKFKQQVSRFNQWFIGPVFMVNATALVTGVVFSDLGSHYQNDTFWVATKQVILTLAQSLGLL